MVRLTRQFARLAAVILMLHGGAPAAWCQTFDIKFLDSLRQRRQFEEAEHYCLEHLTRSPVSGAGRALIAAELIRTQSLAAIHGPPASRDALFAKAHQTAVSFLNQSPAPPRAAIVQFQDALTLLAQGEVGREEYELGALSPQQVEPTRQALRAAASALESLLKDLEREIPLRRRAPLKGGELSAAELVSLADNIRQQLARAQKNRALLFEAGSTDRVALLIAAAETLERALQQLPDQQPLKSAVQLELVEVQRLLGKYAEADELATALAQPGQPPQVRSLAAAELLRMAAARGQTAEVQRLLAAGPLAAGSVVPEFDLARLEALLYLATTAAGAQAMKYQQQAAAAAQQLDEDRGAYWGRRASQLIAAAVPRGAVTNVALLSRGADNLYLRNELDGAIAAYDDAAAQALALGERTAAFELAYKAALVEQKRGRHAAAAQRQQALVTRHVAHPQAPAAHLLAAWNAAQDARTKREAVATYSDLLTEHIALFPGAETADQARLWLGALHESQAQWSPAITALSAVSQASPHYLAAVEGLRRCWRANLATLAAAGEPTTDAAHEAGLFFRRALAGPNNRWPERWTAADRTAALAAAELIIGYEPGSSSDAEELLRRALTASPDAPPAWRTAAQTQLVVAVGAQGGRQKEAVEELMKIGARSPEQVLQVLDGLSQAAASAPSRAKPTIAALQLTAAGLLSESNTALSAQQQRMVARVRADALAGLGRREDALAEYAKLSADEPDNGLVQEGYARLLLASPDAEHWRLALDRWRLVAYRSKAHSERWYEAKYSVALAQFKLGDRASAATLLRVILEAPPGLAGTTWEQPYRELLRECVDSK